MRLRHLRGSCVTLSLASTASRIVLLFLAGVAVDACPSRSALGVPLFVRLAFEIWGAVGAVRVCTRALRCFGGPVYACALVDRRRRPEPAARPTLVSAAMWAPGCSRTEIRVRTASFAAMGRLVALVLHLSRRVVSYDLETTMYERPRITRSSH